MAQLTYECDTCLKTIKKLYRVAKDAPTVLECPCGKGILARTLGAPAATSKITIDNGQPRAVEVHPDIQELRQEWSKPPNRGE